MLGLAWLLLLVLDHASYSRSCSPSRLPLACSRNWATHARDDSGSVVFHFRRGYGRFENQKAGEWRTAACRRDSQPSPASQQDRTDNERLRCLGGCRQRQSGEWSPAQPWCRSKSSRVFFCASHTSWRLLDRSLILFFLFRSPRLFIPFAAKCASPPTPARVVGML